jgi:hypothetical protein
MAHTTAAIDRLVAELALDATERASVYARAAKYNRECGCALGGVTTLAAFFSVSLHAFVSNDIGLRMLGAGVGIVFTAALVGKSVGLLTASAKLAILRRSLARRAVRETGMGHVNLH